MPVFKKCCMEGCTPVEVPAEMTVTVGVESTVIEPENWTIINDGCCAYVSIDITDTWHTVTSDVVKGYDYDFSVTISRDMLDPGEYSGSGDLTCPELFQCAAATYYFNHRNTSKLFLKYRKKRVNFYLYRAHAVCSDVDLGERLIMATDIEFEYRTIQGATELKEFGCVAIDDPDAECCEIYEYSGTEEITDADIINVMESTKPIETISFGSEHLFAEPLNNGLYTFGFSQIEDQCILTDPCVGIDQLTELEIVSQDTFMNANLKEVRLVDINSSYPCVMWWNNGGWTLIGNTPPTYVDYVWQRVEGLYDVFDFADPDGVDGIEEWRWIMDTPERCTPSDFNSPAVYPTCFRGGSRINEVMSWDHSSPSLSNTTYPYTERTLTLDGGSWTAYIVW